MVVMMGVELLDRNQPRSAAIISLGPRSVSVARCIGIARTRCIGAGRESSQQDE